MKLAIAVLTVLFVLFMFVPSYGQATPKYQPPVQEEPDEKDLGDGFRMRYRIYPDGRVAVMIRVADKYTETGVTIAHFVEGVKIGLLKVFTCEQLLCADEKPLVYVSPPGENQLMAAILRDKILILQFVGAPDEGKGIVGFMYIVRIVEQPIISGK